jgi:acyl carrier protein
MFSSIAATVGSEGQAAYAGANLYLNALAERRRAEGRPALAVNWGAIRETGAVARDQALRDRMVTGTGLDLLPVADALSALEDAMLSELPQIGIGGLPIRAIHVWAAASPTHRLDQVIAATASASSEVQTGRPGSDWAEAPTETERLARLRVLIVGVVRESLGYGIRPIDASLTLSDLGADSLIALQLVHTLERDLSIRFTSMRLLQTKSLDELVDTLSQQCMVRLAG